MCLWCVCVQCKLKSKSQNVFLYLFFFFQPSEDIEDNKKLLTLSFPHLSIRKNISINQISRLSVNPEVQQDFVEEYSTV